MENKFLDYNASINVYAASATDRSRNLGEVARGRNSVYMSSSLYIKAFRLNCREDSF